MAEGQNMQETFLDALYTQQVQVSVYLVNGIKLQGKIEGFDQFVVLLKSTLTQMVYKHAISTIVPAQKINLADANEEESTAEAIDQ